MKPYIEFKRDMTKLIEHAVSRNLDLSEFTFMKHGYIIGKANAEHKCGTAACIAGYAPEVFPDRFKWNRSGHPETLIDRHEGRHIIIDFLGFICKNPWDLKPREQQAIWYLKRIFSANGSFALELSDEKVALRRLAVIKNCRSYIQLQKAIQADSEVF